MKVVDSFAQLDKEEPSRELFNCIRQAVIEGMWPFAVGSVIFSTDHNASWFDMRGTWTLRIRVNLPGFDLEFDTVLSDAEVGLGYAWIDRTCLDIRDQLRYRRTAPIPDNVILGED